ncbi:response regulator [Chitinophaga parva]|uniref:Response regulator n=1 Tax=Chitinophaga parva TaxID=2169414 RepID=A0A2T7BC01_9BACT|nr:response regulator [Chitinophaga parva]PUZ21858.1 response regulator [Chitinophaga parva]
MTTAPTCLIVDDDVDDQEIFSMALRECGRDYPCIFINNAIDALAELTAGDLRPQYIFLDLNMPRMNGIQALEQLREMPNLSHIPVVIYSTSMEELYLDKTRALGAAAFITKPPTLRLLSQALDDFFNQQSNTQPSA